MNIWLQRLSGGEPEKITDYSDLAIFRFEPSPDGRSLVLNDLTEAKITRWSLLA